MSDEEKKIEAPYCLEPLPKSLIKAISEHFDEIYNDDTEEDDDI
jgi:hypothetical protein